MKSNGQQNSSDNTNLESSLDKLEKIVADLESGKLPLDESLLKFEEGVRLYKVCKSILNKVEKKIKVLTESLKEEDFVEKE